ncbi:hypothetical protein ACFL4N_07225 [Thermodesulfobacteriota bacterium]
MNKQFLWKMIALCIILAFAGCASSPSAKVQTSTPKIQRVSNEFFNAEIEPLLSKDGRLYNAFHISVTNKTGGDLFIEWNQTYYLYNGKKAGLFLWEGIDWEALEKAKKHPLVKLTAGITHTSEIFPQKLVGRDPKISKTSQMYLRGFLPAGENGVLLTVKKGDKKIEEKMTVLIKE